MPDADGGVRESGEITYKMVVDTDLPFFDKLQDSRCSEYFGNGGEFKSSGSFILFLGFAISKAEGSTWYWMIPFSATRTFPFISSRLKEALKKLSNVFEAD